MRRAYDYLKGHTYFIATEDGDQARVRPFGSLFLYEDRLYISTSNDKKVYEQMKANPKIELAAIGKGGWIRITAEAVGPHFNLLYAFLAGDVQRLEFRPQKRQLQ